MHYYYSKKGKIKKKQNMSAGHEGEARVCGWHACVGGMRVWVMWVGCEGGVRGVGGGRGGGGCMGGQREWAACVGSMRGVCGQHVWGAWVGGEHRRCGV